jgi:hypothetical protein
MLQAVYDFRITQRTTFSIVCLFLIVGISGLDIALISAVICLGGYDGQKVA